MQDPTYILGAERFGTAYAKDGKLNIGGLEVPWGRADDVNVYVRRSSKDLEVLEIHMAQHDGLNREANDRMNEEAEHHPLGPKDYWHSKMVGNYTYGPDGHSMTEEEFEDFWTEYDGDDE